MGQWAGQGGRGVGGGAGVESGTMCRAGGGRIRG